MTVQTNTNVASFNGNGVTQIFPIAFKFNNDTDLVVLLVDDDTGAASTLTLNSDYTVSGEGDEEGGLINVVVAPAAGQRLKVSRIVDILQLLDLRNQGKFFAEVHEDALDLLTMIAQQHQSEIASSIRVAEPDPEPARLPPAASRANMLMAFDAFGNPVVSAPASGSSAELAISLANSVDPTKGAGLVGYNGGTVASALGLILGRRISPFDYGATGDGIADDTSAFVAAIAAAESTGLAIDLQGGLFRVGELTTIGVDIFSAGGGFKLADGAQWIIDVNGSRDVNWKGFTLDGANSAIGRAFKFSASGNVRFSDINIVNWTQRVAFFESGVSSALIHGGVVRDCTSADVYCYKASHGKFSGIHFLNCSEHVIRFGRFESDPEVLSINTAVTGCTFRDVLNDPVLYELGARRGVVAQNNFANCRRIVKIESTASAQTQDIVVSNNVFTSQTGVAGEAIKMLGVVRSAAFGNQIDGAAMGITAGNQCRIAGNYIRNITDYGILYGASSTVSGNVLDAVGGDGIRAADSSSSRAAITGNCATAVAGIGINSSGPDCVITGNTIQSTGAAVRLVSSSGNCLVVGNNFRGAGAIVNTSTGSVVANNVV